MTGSLSDCCVSHQVGTRSSRQLTWWVQCPQITSTQHVVNVTRIVRTAPSEPLHLRKDTTTPHSGAIFSKISPTVEFIRNELVNYTGKNNVTAFHMGKRWKLHVLYWSLFKCCVICPVSQTFYFGFKRKPLLLQKALKCHFTKNRGCIVPFLLKYSVRI